MRVILQINRLSQLYSINAYYMKTSIALTGPSKKVENAPLLSNKIVNKKKQRNISSLHKTNLKLKRVRKSYCKFYKVFKNDTSVTEVFTNDFKTFRPTYQKIKAACALHSREHPAFSLPADDFMFYGFLSRIRAMEYAKARALRYISKLIEDGEKGYDLLIKYSEDHYDDLNINLTDRNIRKIEWELEEG